MIPAGPDAGAPRPGESDPEAPQASVASRTIKGLFWGYGAYVGGRALVLVSTAILARLLTPADFGLVALALVVMTFLDTIRDLGLTQALIGATPEDAAEQTQTVFVASVAIGGTLAVLAAAASPLVADLLGHQALTAIICVLAVNFLLQTLGATHDALIRKRLDYRARTIADAGDIVVRGAVSVGLALSGAGVWALVVGYVSGTLVRLVLLWSQEPWRPSWSFPRDHLRGLVRFGGTLTLVDIGSAVIHNMDYLFIGTVLGSTSLGLYTIGFRLPELLILNLAVVASDVLFPAYAALERVRLRAGYLISLRYIAALVLPVAAALVVLAEPIVMTLFGSKFEGSVEVMRVLAIFALLSALNIPAGTIYKVTGRAHILLYCTLPYLIGLFVALLLVTDRGIVAVALALSGCQAVIAVVSLAIASHILGVRAVEMWRSVAGPAAASAVMVAALLVIVTLVSAAVPALLLGILVGLVVYGASLWALDRDLLLAARTLVSPPPVPVTTDT